ncbi:hypothetical protein CFP56_028118 [Quercus suber]|uniref:Major facilitator superfamily (MFS) profile domain-containing protein n=1 Tax=Quercus suber TaxID=58331 RepID=A0AAW0JUW8_QUESU
MKSEALTLVLVNLAGIMERADEALLPGVYKEVGEALHIDPTGLGSLTLFRSLVQSSCYPIAAYLALRHNRAHVIALGAFLWAAATFCVAISSTFFQVIVAQGVFGSFSGSAWSFAPMWLELVGFSHEETAFLWTILVIGVSLGGLFGGRMGDIVAKRLLNTGRIILSQISSGSAIPLIALFLLVLPYDPSTAFMHGLVLFIIGFCASWEAPATNK